MSRSATVLVRIDRTGHTVSLIVAEKPTAADRQELTRRSERARKLFPDATVTVELRSSGAPIAPSFPRHPRPHPGAGQRSEAAPAAAPVDEAASRCSPGHVVRAWPPRPDSGALLGRGEGSGALCQDETRLPS